MRSTTNQNNGVRITIDEGEGIFFVSSKRVGKDNYRHEFMSRDGLKALARVAELLGLKAEAHGEAVAEAFNRQRVETLEEKKRDLARKVTDMHVRAVTAEQKIDQLLAVLADLKDDVLSFGGHEWDCRFVISNFVEPCSCWNAMIIEKISAAIANTKGSPPSAPCLHPSTITQHMGDGTPVYYCPDCGRNEAMPVRFQCDDTEGGAA